MAQSTVTEVKASFTLYVKHYIRISTNITPTTTTFQFNDNFEFISWTEAKCVAPTMEQLQNYTAAAVENTRMLIMVAINPMLQCIKNMINTQSRKSSILGSLLLAPPDMTDQNIVDLMVSNSMSFDKMNGSISK